MNGAVGRWLTVGGMAVLGWGGEASPHPAAASAGRGHDVHLTYSRVVLDSTALLWRVRVFRDDLERALRARTTRPMLAIDTPAGDTAFAAYFNATVQVMANGRRLTGRVLEAGRDLDDPGNEMRWYLLELPLAARVHAVSLRVDLLFETFADQRNLVTLLQLPEGSRQSLYFARGDTAAQVVRRGA